MSHSKFSPLVCPMLAGPQRSRCGRKGDEGLGGLEDVVVVVLLDIQSTTTVENSRQPLSSILVDFERKYVIRL